MFSYDKAFERNLGFLSSEEQERLAGAKVAIAGAGGDGGELAVQLARLGIGEVRLADPDPFEIENLNRQAVCTTDTIGVNKAVAVATYLQSINPEINTPVFTDGVTSENVAEFLNGVDLLIDETEFTIHSLGVMLARNARAENIPNLMALNIGFGTTVTTYHPRGRSLERMLGLSESASLEEIAETAVPISRWLPYVPSYGDIEVLKKVATGEKSAPSIAPGVAIAAGTASTQALLNLLHSQNNRKKPTYAPKIRVIDAMNGSSKTIHYPLVSHYRHLAGVAFNNALHRAPKTSY